MLNIDFQPTELLTFDTDFYKHDRILSRQIFL